MKVTHTTVVTGTNDPTKQVSKDAWNEDHVIVEDATSRTVTDAEKATWNAKQDTLVADTDYLQPATASSTYEPKKGADDLYVTTTEKSTWNGKQDAITADTDYLTPSTASTTYEPKKGIDDNYVTASEKSTWSAKQDALVADTDYLTPSTAASTYEPKKGADDNYVTDAEKVVIGSTSGTNTGDQDLSAYAQISSLSSGWYVDSHTWSYSSADDPTFVASVNADMTGVISAGMRVKLTQTTVKNFIVTVVGAYADGATLITLYGGTDYDLADAAISNVYISPCKAPFGFPLDPAKWTETTVDINQNGQATPTQNAWYNLGSISISIPIGVWIVNYQVSAYIADTTSNTYQVFVTLSTANNSESDTGFTAWVYGHSDRVSATVFREKTLAITSKTTYYLNQKTPNTGVDNMYDAGNNSPTIIKAVCAYL